MKFETKDLLDPEKLKEIDNLFSAVKVIKKIKTQQAIRIYRPRLGRDYWKKRFKWQKKVQKSQKQLKDFKIEEAKRKYENRCPKRYETYIKSPWWKERKNKYYQAHGRFCFICKDSRHIDMHHIWYGNHGKEVDNQLMPLCRGHHKQFHDTFGRGTNDFRKKMTRFLKGFNIDRVWLDKN